MAAAIVAILGAPALAAPPAPGAPAPDFALKSIDGHNVRLSEYRGEPVIVLFWATWCGPCRESLATLDAYATQAGVPAVGVNLDGSADRASSMAEALQLKMPTLVDARQDVARTYDVQSLPLTLLIDAQGRVRASWSGEPVTAAQLNPLYQRLRAE